MLVKCFQLSVRFQIIVTLRQFGGVSSNISSKYRYLEGTTEFLEDKCAIVKWDTT